MGRGFRAQHLELCGPEGSNGGIMDGQSHRRSRSYYIVRLVRARPRLFLSGAVALIVMAALPALWRLPTRILVAWDVGIALYLVLAFQLMVRSRVGNIRRRAALEDEGQFAVLVLTVASALASLGAIVAELGSSAPTSTARQPAHLLLATLTILLSWTFTHTIFALHYAHEFYSENHGRGGGLTFPGDEEPDYWDFVYFSFVIGMTSQVSAVAVACKPIRRTVAAHGVVSFIFNAALLALTVNIAASAI
jgi:uncharacterized membrane protein